MSGIDVEADGTGFVATGDSAQTLIGELLRDGDKIVGIESPWIGGWKMPDGNRVDGDFTDAEGIAVGPDGRIYVSFEREHRVWGYADRDAVAEPMGDQAAFRDLRYNSALEALAIDGEGRLYAIPEKPPRGSDRVPVYRQNDDGWEIAATLPEESFRPTGADFDDVGRLYLLERGFGLFGFSTRVRRFELGPDGVVSVETLLETEGGMHDNLEGIAVWRDDRGLQRIIMISDDNFRWFQRTEIVEYRLTE